MAQTDTRVPELSCGRMLTYALVTPARDEAENLRRLAACVVEQSLLPKEWIVVDDGSSDDTLSYVGELAREYPWIRVMTSPGVTEAAGALQQGRRIGRD